jgi:hypothetical protein
MDISLKSMLNGAMAIPYSNELIDTLERACQSYISEDVLMRVDELIVAFVKGDITSQFKDYIRSAMNEEGFHEVPTNDVFVRLAQYIVVATISDDEDELRKSICASKLMNYMLVVKAMKRPVPNIKSLLGIYDYHLSHYLEDVDKLQEDENSTLRSYVPEAEFPFEVSEDDGQTLRLVFKEAELYRIERLLTSEEVQIINNPFVRVYVGLCKMFENMPYYFYNLDLNRIVGLLIRLEEEKKRKKLSNIIDDILLSKYVFEGKYSKTSVVLRMVNNREYIIDGDLMLPVKEFAIYLYFEILTEKIINTLN